MKIALVVNNYTYDSHVHHYDLHSHYHDRIARSRGYSGHYDMEIDEAHKSLLQNNQVLNVYKYKIS